MSWARDSEDNSALQHNEVKMHIAGEGRNIDARLAWDLSRQSEGEMEFSAAGQGRILGNFNFNRNLAWSATDGHMYNMDITGMMQLMCHEIVTD